MATKLAAALISSSVVSYPTVAEYVFTVASNDGVNPLGVRLRDVRYGATLRDDEIVQEPENPVVLDVTAMVMSILPNGISTQEATLVATVSGAPPPI